MIEALTSDRANDALDVGVLPRRLRRRETWWICNTPMVDTTSANAGIAVVPQVPRRFVLGKGVVELSDAPCGRWIVGDADVDGPSSVVGEPGPFATAVMVPCLVAACTSRRSPD